MAMMKISASFPPWDGRPCKHACVGTHVHWLHCLSLTHSVMSHKFIKCTKTHV